MIRINYIDASALVKRFDTKELRSHEVRNYFGALNTFLTTSVCFFETLQVLDRKYKKESLTREEFLCACEELFALARGKEIEIHDVNILTPEAIDQVNALVQSYEKGKKKRLDFSDAFQVVTIKRVFSEVEESSKLLVTADSYLAEVAKTEGIAVWNVMTEPPPSC